VLGHDPEHACFAMEFLDLRQGRVDFKVACAVGERLARTECAWYGDPEFDLAFCLNHLLLKFRWAPMARDRFLMALDLSQATPSGSIGI
jgi:hypothetical protein